MRLVACKHTRHFCIHSQWTDPQTAMSNDMHGGNS